MKKNHYRHLIAMAALSFVAMYILMYAMVNTIADVYMNVNQVYMAGLMTAPMIVIELLGMRGMYHNTKLNALIIAASVLGRARHVHVHQAADGCFRRPVPALDDPTSLRRHPHVRRCVAAGFGESRTVQSHRRESATGNRPDGCEAA